MYRMSLEDRDFARSALMLKAGYSADSAEGQLARSLVEFDKTLSTEEMCVELLAESLRAYRSALRSGESESAEMRERADFALSQLRTGA